MDDALREFHGALAAAYTHAGRPSSRTIVSRVGNQISHTPISEALRFDRLPTLHVVQTLMFGLRVNKREADRIIKLWHKAWEVTQAERVPVRRLDLQQELRAIHDKLDEILKRLPG